MHAIAGAADTGIDDSRRHAFSENTGWVNMRPDTNAGVRIEFDGATGALSGYAWGENIGWICFPTNGFGGVTINAAGQLSGYAWGENVGWIYFPTHGHGGVTLNTSSGEFTGSAWGGNIGWIRFNGTNFGVRSVAFDRQSQGTPNWWLDHHNVNEDYNAGDGVPAWQKYVMDVSPTNAGNSLVITSITNNGIALVRFTPASARRFYTLKKSTNLAAAASWTNVSGQIRVAGAGPSQTLMETNAAATTVYAVEVSE